MPHSDVATIDAGAQYSSNVLNLVLPGFGDGRASAGPQGFELAAATEQALKYLTDSYDDIAFVPVATPVADYGAFHQNVQNAVTGINIAAFNQTSLYGKSQRRTSRFMAHDEGNQAKVGDRVAIVESRPLSARKRWAVTRVVEKAPEI